MAIYNLTFKQYRDSLSGNKFGENTFNDQVKDIIKYNDDQIIFILPDVVTMVGSSFWQGFFEGIIDEIGLIGVKEKVIVKTSKKDYTLEVLEALD